jgi:3-hydroxybutyryl-CoA dehydrogenase
MKRIGKRPLVMKKFVQRFIVNRLQNAIVFAALEILNNGWATAEEIDLALKLSLGIRLPVVGVVQSLDFTGLNLVYEIFKSLGLKVPLIEEKVGKGHLGVSTSKGIYDYGSRNEEEILRHRDMLYLKMLDHLEIIGAFNPL